MSKLTFKEMFPSLDDFECKLIFHDMTSKDISNEKDKKEVEELILENFGSKFLQCCQDDKRKILTFDDINCEQYFYLLGRIFDKSVIALSESFAIQGSLRNSISIFFENQSVFLFKDKNKIDFNKNRYFLSPVFETRIRGYQFDDAIISSITSDIIGLNEIWKVRRKNNSYTVLIFKSEEEVRANFNSLKNDLKEHWSIDLDKDE